MTGKAHLHALVQQCAHKVTDDNGRLDVKDLRDEIRIALENLPPHIEHQAREDQVEKLASSFRAKRNPRPRNGQISFHPEALLPLGNGVSVWMDRATPDDLRTWGMLSTRNNIKVARADLNRQEYVMSRLDAWRSRTNLPHLGVLEREVFGHQGAADPGDFDDDGTEDGFDG